MPPTSRPPLSGIISSSDVTYLLGYYLASHIFICGAFTSFYGRNATLDVPISPFSFFDLLILGGRRSGILFKKNRPGTDFFHCGQNDRWITAG